MATHKTSSTRVNVAIASPTDVKAERDAVPHVFNRWNETHNEAFLHPKMWEAASVPTLGDHPQHLLNPRLIDESELLLAILWSKLGTPTPTASSGTVEEIREFIAKKGPARVMVYFCTRNLPYNIDPAELSRLKEFKAQMQSQGVYHEYDTIEEFERDLYYHLDAKVQDLLAGKLPLPIPPEEKPKLTQDKKHPDPRLNQPIDFGTTLKEISNSFSKRMSQFNAIDGFSNDKFYALGAHVYASAASCLDRFLALSAAGMSEQNRAPLERISIRLKRLAATLPDPDAPFPKYWNDGCEISEALSAHVAYLEKWGK